MTTEQDCADAAATPALLLWSRLIQGAAAAAIVLSLTLLLSPRLGVWGNVLLNTATGLMFGIPLLFSRRHFIAKP